VTSGLPRPIQTVGDLFYPDPTRMAQTCVWGLLGRSATRGAPSGPPDRPNQGGGLYPPGNCATVQLRTGLGDAKKRGRIRPWGRHRCSLLQPIALACKAGAVSRRYFLPLRPFANVGVAGSRPSFARQAQAGEARQRARSRAPDNHQSRQVFGLVGLMRLNRSMASYAMNCSTERSSTR
jgi:hypothetical protein